MSEAKRLKGEDKNRRPKKLARGSHARQRGIEGHLRKATHRSRRQSFETHRDARKTSPSSIGIAPRDWWNCKAALALTAFVNQIAAAEMAGTMLRLPGSKAVTRRLVEAQRELQRNSEDRAKIPVRIDHL
jgi:hypothetical protein